MFLQLPSSAIALKGMRSCLSWWAFFFALLLSFTPLRADQVNETPVNRLPLVFGVYTHIRPTEMYRKMTPFLQYLRDDLAGRGIDVDLQMKIFPTYAGAIEALSKGKIDFARFGPVSYVLAKDKNPGLQLLAMESNGGSKLFNGVITVPKGSLMRSIEQLRGKRVAFGDSRSTTGRYLPQALLAGSGISSSDLGGHSYLGRHDKVAFAVASGKYHAGAINENTFNKYSVSKGLRKIAEFPSVTKPWIAREGLDFRIFHGLRDSLFGLKDKKVLKSIKRDGFLAAEDGDYDMIRNAIKAAEAFGSNQ
ncbi:MAG: PhnD/SsuA/transferrin family substrate-binding protein [Candidatus Sedimenticola sp. 6PFRAG1]